MTDKEKIIFKGFFDELEKTAQFLPTLFKVLKSVGTVTKNLGTKGKLLNYAEEGLKINKTKGLAGLKDYVSAFKDEHFLSGGKGFVQNSSNYLKNSKNFVEGNQGWVQRNLANKLDMLNSFKGGPKGVLKSWGQELRDTRYRSVDINKSNVVWKNGKAYVKGRGFMPNKEILNLPKGVTDSNSYNNFIKSNVGHKNIVKRTIGSTAWNAGMTTPVLGALPLTSGVNKDSMKESATGMALNYIPGGWDANFAYHMTKNIFKKKPPMQQQMNYSQF